MKTNSRVTGSSRVLLFSVIAVVSVAGLPGIGMNQPLDDALISIFGGPSSVEFSDTVIGNVSTRDVLIVNGPSSAGTLSGSVDGLASPFAIAGGGGFSLSPGQSITVTVQFSPVAEGVFSDALEISHNAGNLPTPVLLPVSGSGITPPPQMINIFGGPSALTFGLVEIGSIQTIAVFIVNDSNSTGTLSGTIDSLAAPFSIVSGGGSYSLAPGEFMIASVQFAPADMGAFSGTLNIVHNAGNLPSPVTLPVSGSTPVPVDDPIAEPIEKGGPAVKLVEIASGLTAPNWGTHAPGDPTRLFVTDQVGILWVLNLTTGDKSVFADTRALVVPLGIAGPETFDERGLLGVAFHPQYFTNGLLYTYTSETADGAADFSTLSPGTMPNHQSVIREWMVTDPTDFASVVDPNSSRVLLRIDQPQFNHDGGAMAFGPDDMLYIALGDGGASDDQGNGHGDQGNGQNSANILGTILRIDPRGFTALNRQYGVPIDNPFFPFSGVPYGGQPGCADGFCDEIFAYGFRNPFRFSFDKLTGALYAADVGQNDIEEVDIVFSGGNYGWRIKEGSFCFAPNGDQSGFVTGDTACGPLSLIDPVAEYDHDEGLAIIGGFVYRGAAIQDLQGHYIFGDYSGGSGNQGRVFLLQEGEIVQPDSIKRSNIFELQFEGRDNLGMFLLGFGEDASGEVYVLGNSTGIPFGSSGVVMKIVP